MHGNTLNPDAKPAPPSREAEIAARLKRLAYYNDPLAYDDLRYLLAQLQQARQEQARAAIEFGAEAEAERLKAQALQSSIDHCAQRVLALAAALQQAREALTRYGQHEPGCVALIHGPCTCGLDAALKAGR